MVAGGGGRPLETLVEAEVEMSGVSNLTHLVLLLPKLAKNAWQFKWAWRKIGGVLACVEQEMKLESIGGIPEQCFSCGTLLCSTAAMWQLQIRCMSWR